MSTILDEKPGILDSESEVKKLQDLVRKLERQNQALRSKQSDREKDSPDKYNVELSAVNKTVNNDRIVKSKNHIQPDAALVQVKNVIADDVALLDIESKSDAELEEDEWLYQSPKKPSSPHQVNTYNWMREEFEHPSPELEGVRRSLIHKLEEVSRMPTSISTGSLSSIASLQPLSTSTSMPIKDLSPSSNPSTSQFPPSTSSQSLQNHKPTIKQTLNGCNTFTRPKKKLPTKPREKEEPGDSGNSSDEPLSFSASAARVRASPQHLARPHINPPLDEAGGDTEESVMKDVEDVQVVARMQEERLRQSQNSPYMPKKNLQYRSSSQEGLLDQSDSRIHTGTFTRRSSGQSGRKGLLRSGEQENVQRSNASLESVGSSNSSGAASSPYDSNPRLDQPHLTHPSAGSESLRRSLPNLARPGLSVAKQPVSQEEPAHLTQSSHTKTSRLTPPRNSQLQRQHSPARTQSPQRSGLPMPRSSGIPRPGSASKLPTPRKSSIPSSVRRIVTAPRLVDDSWKDGCF